MYDVLFSSILLKDDIIHNTLLCHHYQAAHTTKYFLIYCSLMSAKLSFSSCIGEQDFSLITSKPTGQPHQKIEIISTTDQTRKCSAFSFQFLPRGLGLNVVGGVGSGEGPFLRFRLVCILILSILLSLESSQKFVWWWWVVVGV